MVVTVVFDELVRRGRKIGLNDPDKSVESEFDSVLAAVMQANNFTPLTEDEKLIMKVTLTLNCRFCVSQFCFFLPTRAILVCKSDEMGLRCANVGNITSCTSIVTTTIIRRRQNMNDQFCF